MMTEEKLHTPYGLITLKGIEMNEWKELNTMWAVANAESLGMEIEGRVGDGHWLPWNGTQWSSHCEYRARPRKPAETHAQLTHTRSCSALTPGEDCTCCLKERQNTQTAETMHAAWRKRAEEAEQELAKLKEPRKPTKMQVKSLCWRSTQYGSLHWWDETQVIGKGFARFPSGDITGEVEA